MNKPVLIYDGECRFCCRCVERLRDMTGDLVDYETSQASAWRWPEIAAGEFDKAVQWIGPDGERCSGPEAVYRAMAEASWLGRFLLETYRGTPLFARASETGYYFVARNRGAFSLVTRLLWGKDLRKPTYAAASSWFLRALGIIYLIAFISYGIQMPGLNGSNGILPAQNLFSHLKGTGLNGFLHYPSLCWLGAGDTALAGWTIAGIVAALLLTIGVARAPCLIFLWAVYLSLSVAGQVFYEFQWDTLLLEAGFFAIFLTPWTWVRARVANPPAAARFLLVWLLFRLMVASGAAKLCSGDPSWSDGTALTFHYFTQPLPTPFAWSMQQLPDWFQWLSTKTMFGIELVLPFLLFGPKRLRLLAAAGLVGLQVLIALTGNYGFFNLLTLALCLLALDDSFFRKPMPEPARFLPNAVLIPVAVIFFSISLVPFAVAFRRPLLLPVELIETWETIQPFRTINYYGLFAAMTKERREIIVQGSDDGVTWKTYHFRYKPGGPRRAPPWVEPYMPRLDWQMWFAALGTMENNPWFASFLQKLADGSPAVLGLLENNPFPGKPPRYLRALSDDYQFTNWESSRNSRDWWKTEPAAVYCPAVSFPRE